MTTEPIRTYQAHRFRDLLALSIDDKPTIYLTHQMAKHLRQDLEDFERDVDTLDFRLSLFGSRVVVRDKPH